MFFRKPLIVTHNSNFHPDDVCSVATLSILLNGRYRLIRTRDPKIIEKADYVVDVGGIHVPAQNRFDHHQKGGAGNRENGIPYAAFGLVWKTYGAQLAGSAEAAESIDENFVAPADASDNGFSIINPRIEGIKPYEFGDYVFSFNPSWNEKQDFDIRFIKAVAVAVPLIKRLIDREKRSEEGKKFTEAAYQRAIDKRIIELDGQYPCQSVLSAYPEPLFIVRKYPDNDNWGARGVRVSKDSFDVRESFPVAWAGLRDADLAKVSGVPDAVFCHNNLFLAVAKSREGALALAKKALER